MSEFPLLEQGLYNALASTRLSTLRHDLRTPFNQIIGYSEMMSEDADSADNRAISKLSLAIVGTSHAMLTRMTEALSGTPESITPEYLAATRQVLAPDLATLQQMIHAMRTAVEAETSIPEETAGNLNRMEAAFTALSSLVAATSLWHYGSSETTTTVRKMESRVIPSSNDTFVQAPAVQGSKSSILIVDDHIENRDLLRQRLAREGFDTAVAADGEEALRMLMERSMDLVLLDVLMPGMDGIEVLQRIKSDEQLKDTPVIMISALDEVERVVQCLEGGAEDYLTKPFNPAFLRARIGVTLERKRLRDEEKRRRVELDTMLSELTEERTTTQRLLLNILPKRVAADLQQGHCAPMYFEDTTIGFTDFVGFTLSTEHMAAEHLVEELHIFFTAFDHIMERYGLEKMKTIGDSYMFASGLPERHPANPVNAVLAAFELLHETERLAEREGAPGWKLRIGLHTGPVIAGVVGIRKFAFDIWGDSVNFASRMESSGSSNRINISERTYTRVKDFFVCEPRGKVITKDNRTVDMFFVQAIQPNLIADGTFVAFARRYRLYFSMEPPSFPEFLLSTKA